MYSVPLLERASPRLNLLDLPLDLLRCILPRLDLAGLGATARTCSLLAGLAKASSLHSVSLSASLADSQPRRLRELLATTRALMIRNSSSHLATHSGRFCRLHPPFGLRTGMRVTACGSLLDEGAASLISMAPLLRALDLTNAGHVSSATVAHVLRSCALLEVLGLRGCWRATVGLAEATAGVPPCQTLRSLDLSRTDTTDADLTALLQRTPALRELQLNFCEHVTDEALQALPPSLGALGVLGCARVGYHRLQELSKGIPRLRSDDTFVEEAFRRVAATGGSSAEALHRLLGTYYAEATG